MPSSHFFPTLSGFFLAPEFFFFTYTAWESIILASFLHSIGTMGRPAEVPPFPTHAASKMVVGGEKQKKRCGGSKLVDLSSQTFHHFLCCCFVLLIFFFLGRGVRD